MSRKRQVNNMDEQQWKDLAIEVNEYLEANEDLGAGIKQVIALNLSIGDNDPSERQNCETAIKAMLKGRSNAPFGRGKKSAIPATVRVSIESIARVVQEAHEELYNYDTIMPSILVGRGGKVYSNSQEYGQAQSRLIRTKLGKLYKSGEWDGTVDSLLPTEEDLLEEETFSEEISEYSEE